MATITICSSVSFYRQAIDVQARLEAMGYIAVIPVTAEEMKQLGDFDVSREKMPAAGADGNRNKAWFIRQHFERIAAGDAILVLNHEKHGADNYIGANVLMEMALAFYLRKPIFIINGMPKASAFLDEITGMAPIALHGRLEDLPRRYEELSGMAATA